MMLFLQCVPQLYPLSHIIVLVSLFTLMHQNGYYHDYGRCDWKIVLVSFVLIYTFSAIFKSIFSYHLIILNDMKYCKTFYFHEPLVFVNPCLKGLLIFHKKINISLIFIYE